MNLEHVMTQVRIDRTVLGIRRRSWPLTHKVLPGKILEEDLFVTTDNASISGSEMSKFTPNLADLFAQDWEPIR